MVVRHGATREGEERAPCYGTLRRRGRPEVRCGEGLGAAEEDTTTRIGNFCFFRFRGWSVEKRESGLGDVSDGTGTHG